ncbi:hypothetical protein HN827_10000 [archaeon]|jgi:hypothetical protein|nr:hypothetical protein [archaeon]MBT4647900.1 hypothetical protein [archaeon]MBT7393134.1 hypothetical protein [archaeon]
MVKKNTKKKITKSVAIMALDKIYDFFDLLIHLSVDHINQKYKIKKKVEDIREETTKTLYALKREFIKALIESFLLLSALFAIVLGSIILLVKYFEIEYLLLGYGFIISIWILLKMKVKI